ncbi:MAG: polymerase, sigma-24 subunit, subfamily [Streptosporangiaceae bacterium]|nr:polymerase, sigma-24 subunit, subfamily [Streptosporangiaceae bacterium]
MGNVVRELDGASDATLFRLMAASANKPGPAQAAFGEMYQRHLDAVYRRCRRFAPALGGAGGAQDLLQDTFVRAFERANTYVPNEGIGPLRERNLTMRWLAQIATRLFLDIREAQIRERETRSQEWYDRRGEEERTLSVHASEKEDGENLSAATEARRKLACSALAALIERDRHIVLVSLDWYDRTKARPFRVPPDVIIAVCEKFQITTDYYRQIRGRAMKQLSGCLTGPRRTAGVA